MAPAAASDVGVSYSLRRVQPWASTVLLCGSGEMNALRGTQSASMLLRRFPKAPFHAMAVVYY